MSKAIIRPLILAALMVGVAGPAFAQSIVPDAQVGTASPGRVDKQFEAPEVMTRMAPRVEVREAAIQQAPAGAEKVRFTLQTLDLDGVSVYGDGELAEVYGSYVGQNISLADLYTIAADLTRKYRNDGYVLTQVVVPPQTIEGGTARLQVVEGYINNITVEGEADDPSLALIRKYAAKVETSGSALNVRDLERAMLLINDIPGASARGILSPSPTTPGAAELLIIPEHKLVDGALSVDNYGSRYLGPIQFTAAASLNSLFGNNERLTAQIVTTPTNFRDGPEMVYWAASYEQPVWDAGTVFEVFANESFTQPGYDLEDFDVKGRSVYVGTRVRHPFIRSRNVNLTGRLTFDYRDVDSRNNIEDTRKDNIRAARLGGRYELLDTFLGVGYNVFDVEVSQGLDILGANHKYDLNVSRPDGDPTFTKIEAEVQRLQKLTSKVNLLIAAQGQASNDSLYSSEEFGVGGIAYGRGYDSSEIIGDDGIAGKLELQWNSPVNIPIFSSYQLFGFVDSGRVWNKDATTSKAKVDTLTSTGFGIRANFTPATQMGAMVAVPLNRKVQTQKNEEPRGFVSLIHKF